MRIGHRTGACAILRRPLLRTSRALCQLPFVAEQIFEEVVAPLRRRGGPGHFQAAADRVAAVAVAETVLPAEALILDQGTLGLGRDILFGIGSAVSLAKVCPPAMSATVSSSFIAMRPNVSRISRAAAIWIRLSVGSFRIYINQAHLHRAERIVEFTIAFIALIPPATLSPDPS